MDDANYTRPHLEYRETNSNEHTSSVKNQHLGLSPEVSPYQDKPPLKINDPVNLAQEKVALAKAIFEICISIFGKIESRDPIE